MVQGFHSEGVGRDRTAEQNRAHKECRVAEGRAHAALVYDGTTYAGWCQFGSPDELPTRRITCFCLDKGHRGEGIASAALAGALKEIARLGGGTVESYPEDAEGRKVSGSFLHNARSHCSSATDSSVSGRSARTGGSCGRSCALDGRP